ncbi:MAG: hypothetical protein ACRC36_18120 [Lacrimispora sphenoides]
MGKIWMPGGGGGADLDVITAGAGDVLAGKVTVDKDGNPLPGTMTYRGTGYHGVGVGLNTQGLYYYIGPGYYYENPTNNPWVYMSRTEVATTLGIEPWKMRGDVNVCGVQGGIPMQNPDVSGTDRVRATSMSNWAGTINLQVRNGHYLNGVNWVQQDIPNYQPWNIKKGVDIGGVVGNWEGYVASSIDLYYRGDNKTGFESLSGSSAKFDSGQISINYADITIQGTFNMTGYSQLNLQGYCTNGNIGDLFVIQDSSGKKLGAWNGRVNANTDYSVAINISALQMSGTFRLNLKYLNGAVYRIWLS